MTPEEKKAARNVVLITKEFDFDAAHYLPMVPADHKCRRMHGHTYRVVLGLEGGVDPVMGWFIDYAEIAAAWAPLHAKLDHRTLNEVPGLENPTTEVLAMWLVMQLTSLSAPAAVRQNLVWVRVYESSTTYCQAWAPPKP